MKDRLLFNKMQSQISNPLSVLNCLYFDISGISGGGALGANALPSKYHVPFSDETEI